MVEYCEPGYAAIRGCVVGFARSLPFVLLQVDPSASQARSFEAVQGHYGACLVDGIVVKEGGSYLVVHCSYLVVHCSYLVVHCSYLVVHCTYLRLLSAQSPVLDMSAYPGWCDCGAPAYRGFNNIECSSSSRKRYKPVYTK
jgi:hypothetical protein